MVLATASVKDDDSSLVITELVEQLVCELGSPQLDGQSGIESLEVTNGMVSNIVLRNRRAGGQTWEMYNNFPWRVHRSFRVAVGLRNHVWTKSWISDNLSRGRETLLAMMLNCRPSHTMP